MSLDLAWAAGYFDGEGCVIYDVNPTRYNIQSSLRIGCSSLEALGRIQSLLGGTVVELSEKYKVNLQQYLWYTNVDTMLTTAKTLLPFSFVKTKELELFIEAISTQIHHRLPTRPPHIREAEIQRRLHYHNKMKELRSYQKRGVGHTGVAYALETQRVNEEIAEQEEQETPIKSTLDPFRWVK